MKRGVSSGVGGVLMRRRARQDELALSVSLQGGRNQDSEESDVCGRFLCRLCTRGVAVAISLPAV